MTSRNGVRIAAAATLAGIVTAACGVGAQSRRPDGQPARTASTITASTPSHADAPLAAAPLPRHALLRVPALSQLPELPNGCEVTSLAMLLAAAHRPVPKLTLARLEPRDPAPAIPDDGGLAGVRRWGDPEVGFVGSVTGDGIGYGIYHKPLSRLLDRMLPRRALDLTGAAFDDVLRQVARGRPVLVWATTTFAPTDEWVTWRAHGRVVHATAFEHAALLVGYDQTHVYVNNPLTGAAAQREDRVAFLHAWIQLGRQALTYRDSPRPR